MRPGLSLREWPAWLSDRTLHFRLPARQRGRSERLNLTCGVEQMGLVQMGLAPNRDLRG